MWKNRIEALLAAGMTVQSVAAEMDVTANAVREILAGRTVAPRASAAIKLLGVRPELFGEQPPKSRKKVA